MCFLTRDWKLIVIGLGNDLVLGRWHYMTWTYDDQGLWRHMVSLGRNMLIKRRVV